MSERLRFTRYPDVRVEHPQREGCRCGCDRRFRSHRRYDNERPRPDSLLMPAVPWWSCLLVFLLLPTLVWCAPKRLPRPLSEDDVCNSMDIRNSLDSFDKLTNCTVIEGHLKILLMEHAKPEEYDRLHFPKLVQVTDFVLLYRVYGLRSLKTIFPNLAVIRGVKLFFDYALVAFEVPELEEIGLPSLVHISRGAVRLEKNPNLCYIHTIDWNIITKQATVEDYYISSNKKEDECVDLCPKTELQKDKCPLGLTGTKKRGLCWSYDTCQQVCQCVDTDRACHVNHTARCCHPECVGGCFGPEITDCVACRGFYSRGRCLKRCEPQTFEFNGWRCILAEECSNKSVPTRGVMRGALGMGERKRYRAIDSKCTEHCPDGYTEDSSNPTGCKKCDGKCPKVCQGDAVIGSVSEAQSYRGCTVIKGSLVIHLQGGEHVVKSLDKFLGDIEEVHKYIQIARSSNLVSLKFLKNLRKIHGINLYQQRYAFLVVGNHYLQEIWDTKQGKHPNLTLAQGSFYFHENPHLCVHRIEEVKEHTTFLNKTHPDHISPNNGEKMLCKHDEIKLYITSVSYNWAFIKFPMLNLPDQRQLLGYVMHYKEAPSKNLTILSSKLACDNEGWISLDAHTDFSRNSSPNSTKGEQQKYHLGILSNLKPWTQYGIYVDTYMLSHSAKGGISQIVYFRTHASVPTNPRDITVAATGPNQLLVKWKPPRQPNGNVTHYLVYWQKKKLRTEQFDMRDYCKFSMVHYDRKEDSTVLETNRTKDPNCCACPKTAKQKNKEEAERLFEIQFENYLHNTVYEKRPVHYNNNFMNGENVDSRKKRSLEMLKFNNTLSPPGPGIFDLPNYNMTPPNITLIRKNETELDERDLTPYLASVVYFKTELVLTQLHHFQEYSIEVLACHGDIENRLCSNRAIATGRTLSSETADTIPEENVTTVELDDGTGRIMLKWAEPPHPNGLIVTYQVHAGRVKKLVEEEESVNLCVPHKLYSENGGGYVMPEAILKQPGNYSFRLQATSLVGNGSWTKDFFFMVKSKETDGPFPTEIIAGIVTSAAFVVLTIVALGVWFVAKRRFSQNNPNGILYASVNPEYISVGKLEAYIPDEWEVPRDKIALLRELGQGSFGMVYEGLAKNLCGEKEFKIAVKTVNEGASLRDRIEFLNEASVMKAFNCNHVVKLKGVVSQGQPTLVLMELMGNGDLKHFLRLHRPDEEDNAGREPLTLKQILEMAGEIADGMAYLSDKKYVHRDLAARNCMVDCDLVVKIGDFGMTRDIYERDYYRKGGKGLLPVRWMSPESLKDGVFSSQSDVWSYGVVLWEMATLAAQPYQGLSNEQVLKFVIDGELMEKPEGCPPKLYILMMKCWQHNPKHRPTFHEIIELLVPDLNPHFKEVSYFFSEDNQDVEGSVEEQDEPDARTPLNQSPSREPSRLRDSVHSSDIEAPLAQEDTVSVDMIPPTKDLYKLPRSVSNHSSTEAPIISSNDGSKGSSKSNSSSYGLNGLANGHVPRQAPRIC